MSKRSELIERACELLEQEHPGCTDNTCMIRPEFVQWWPLHIMNQFVGSGAASPQFERVAAEFRSRFKRPFELESKECRQICRTIAHFECKHCSAVVWDFHGDWSEGDAVGCDSCANDTVWKGQTNI